MGDKPECRITSTNPSTTLRIAIEHAVQVLVDLLGNPPMRVFFFRQLSLRHPRQQWHSTETRLHGAGILEASVLGRSFSTRVVKDINLGYVMKGCYRFKRYTVQVGTFAIRDSSFRRLDFSDVGLSHICVHIRTNIGVIGHTRERNAQKCSVDVGARTMIPVSRLAPSLVIL